MGICSLNHGTTTSYRLGHNTPVFLKFTLTCTCIIIRMHPYAHPQHLKVLKQHFVYIQHGCGMQLMGVGSLQYRYFLGTRASTGSVTSQSLAQSLLPKNADFGRFIGKEGSFFKQNFTGIIDMYVSELGCSELVQRLLTFFHQTPCYYDYVTGLHRYN